MKILAILLTGILISPLMVSADPGNSGFQISSSAFEDKAPIPKEYTCEGKDVNPPLEFKNVPSSAQSLALTVSDPDAPAKTWSHWVIYNIPPNTEEIIENTNPGIEGLNDFGKSAYGGPCPPAGTSHHYIFHAYALDTILNMHKEPAFNEVEEALQKHIIAQTQLVGTYQK